jgi:uncharacterized membrane protein HdeD (DUF308 family)
MLLNPLSDRDSFGIDEAEQVAKDWWFYLFSGIVSLVFGALILSVDWGVDSLAAFIGVLFIIEGVAWAITRPLDGGSRSTNLIAGALAAAAGIALLVWPGKGLYTLAVFIGIEVPIGIWAMRRPGLTLAVIVTLAGAWAIVTGIWQIVIAFEIRSLPRRFRGVTPAV